MIQFKRGGNMLKTLLAGAVACAMSLPVAAQELPAGPKVRLLAVTQVLTNLPQYTRVDQPVLRDELPKKSGGRVEVQLYSWPERNVNGPEVLRLVRSGQVDVSSAPLGMVAGDAPILDGMDLAGLAQDIRQARRIADALVPAANKDLERMGIKIVGTLAFSKQVMFCRKPVPSLTDLQGMKVRAAGPSLGDLVKAFNGQPVSVNFGEVYTALERGTIDCAVTGTGGGNSAKWTEVTTHLVNYPMQWAVAGYYVNLGWWNKLDAPVRNLLERTFQDITDRQWALGEEITEDGLACNFGNAGGCKIHTLLKKPMVEVKADAGAAATVRKQLVEVVLPGWVKRCGERCGQIYNDVVAPISGVKYTAR
jgi:TRAP-type C4-dicarboxylate transport system substrate-binding protein